MNGWRLLVAGGVVLVAVGVVEIFQPDASPLPDSELLLSVLGGLALLYALALLSSRRVADPDTVETPDVELTAPPEIPGTSLGATLDGFPDAESLYGTTSASVRRDLQKAAVAVLTRSRGLDPGEARQQVVEGTWTSDPHAAAYLGESVDPSFRYRIRSVFVLYRQRARERAVDAIAAVAGVDRDNRDETDVTLGERLHGTGTTRAAGAAQTPRQTHHWTGISVVVLVCLGLGVVLEAPGVLLAGVVAVGFAAYARSTPQGRVELSVSRSLAETDPEPGEQVEVTVTVTNEGGFCPDLRIVDGVPESLAVTDGSPRVGTTLRTGRSVTFSYVVTARQGHHEFGPTLVVARNLSNSVERVVRVDADTTLASVPGDRPVQEPVPLRRQPTQYAGQAPTADGGEGIAFHTVREYQPGDSMARIDWNRRARTGELTTLEFQRERATRVLVLVDVRQAARVGHAPGAPDAIERALAAAQRIVPALLDNGHQVGIGAFGPQDCFLAPDSGVSHRQRCRDLLATDPAFHARTEPDRTGRYWPSQLRRRLPDNTQLLVISPLLDAGAAKRLREFEAHGHPVTVLSPDPTTTATGSCRLMRARRRLLVTELRGSGVPVLDWSPGEPLETVLRREVTAR